MISTKQIAFLVFLVLVGISPFAGSTANAAEREPNVRTERTPAMREFVFKRFSYVRDLAEKGERDKALASLDDLREQGRTNFYETAMMWNLYAYLHYSNEDYGRAINAYRKVIAQEGIPQSLYVNTLYSMAQLHIAQGEYRQALAPLQQWFDATEEPNSRAYVFLAQVHMQLDELDKAAGAIGSALERAQQQGVTPDEQWYMLARAIYYQQRDYERLRDVLASLALTYPKREYWVQLAAVFGELGDEKRQIAALEAAFDQGLFEKERDYVSLAQLLLGNEVPYKAARIMEEGIKQERVEQDAANLRLLADAYMMAKEHDEVVAVLKRAGNLAADGELYLRLAQVELDRGNWKEASVAAEQALAKGNLDRPDVAHVIRGLSAFNLKQYDAARTAFGAAAKYKDSEDTARQWLDYVEREQSRQRQLEAMLESTPLGSSRGDELSRTADELTIGS